MITLNDPSSKTRPAFEKTRKELKVLSDRELLSKLQGLNQRERKLKVLVLIYLSEIDARKLYLPFGYSSLFDFCTGHLGYTRATAARRIRSARATSSYPEALDLLLSGEINITTLSMISDILDQDNHAEMLSGIRGRSTRQVELLVSRHRPVHVIRDTVRPVCVMRRVEEPAISSGTGPSAETRILDQGPPGDDERCKSNKTSSSAETKRNLPEQIILEQRLKLGFTVTPEFMSKYDRIKSLLSSKFPGGINFEMLFDILMNEYLEKHDPDKRRSRSRKKASKGECHNNIPDSRRNSRHIPSAVRDHVYARDKGKCTFVGANGKRCGSRWDLEIDHVVPFARGGDNSPGNLRLLCRRHNMHQAERIYGREFIKHRIMRE